VRHLESQDLVVNARRFKQRPVSHDELFLVIRAQRNTFVKYTFPVHIQPKMTEIVMAEKGVRIFKTEKVRAGHHGNQKALGNVSQRSRKREILEFNSRYIITCKFAFAESGIVCQQDRRIQSEAVDL